MKKFCKRMVAVGIFGMLLIGMLWRTNNILRVKGFSAGYSMETFYRQTSGTVDVLNLGNSHMFTNVNPAILWDEYLLRHLIWAQGYNHYGIHIFIWMRH